MIAACSSTTITDLTVPQATTTVDPTTQCEVQIEDWEEPWRVDRQVLTAEGHLCGDTLTCSEHRDALAAALAARGWEIADHSLCRA